LIKQRLKLKLLEMNLTSTSMMPCFAY